MSKTIGLIGNGWGFDAALKGLIKNFSYIEICTENPIENVALLQNTSIKKIPSINDFTSPVIVCAGLTQVINAALLKQKTFINIHYSLLPAYRGLHSTVWALLNDEHSLGYTIHIVNEFIDDGPIIYQYSILNDLVSTSAQYMQLFNEHVSSNLGKILSEFISGKITPMEQDKTKASWVGKRNHEDCKINFNNNIKFLQAFFRALVKPYPLPYFEYKQKKITPLAYKFHYSSIQTHIGRVLNIDDEGIWIKINDGYIVLNNLLDDNGKEFQLTQIKIGTRLLND